MYDVRGRTEVGGRKKVGSKTWEVGSGREDLKGRTCEAGGGRWEAGGRWDEL